MYTCTYHSRIYFRKYGPMSCPMNKKAWYCTKVQYDTSGSISVLPYESTKVHVYSTSVRTSVRTNEYVVTLWYTNCTVHVLISFDERRISLSFPQCTVQLLYVYSRTCNSGSIHAGLARLPETGHQPVSQQLPSVHLYNKSVDKIARAVYFKKLVN